MKEAQISSIAFIGTGVMGASMAGHLRKAGYTLHVYSRTRSKAQQLLDAGARWHESAAAAAREADAVVTMLGYPQDVSSTYRGPHGLLAAARPGTLLVDMTTSEPSLAAALAAEAATAGLEMLDAPVSGGDLGARNATLSIMVGGSAAALERARPLFAVMGKTIVHQGGPGAGQHAKMANQIVIASTMIGVMEALLYARRAGLDPETLLASVGPGAAGSWSLTNLYPRVVRGDFAPGFYVKHFIKDMGIALQEAQARGLELRGLSLALELYRKLEASGRGELGTQALYQILDEAAAKLPG